MAMLYEFSFANHDNSTGVAGYLQDWSSATGTIGAFQTGFYTGGQKFRCTQATASRSCLNRVLPAAVATGTLGMRVSTNFLPIDGGVTANAIASFQDGAITHLTLNINGDGKLEVRRGAYNGTLLATSTNALVANSTYYIEFKATIGDAGVGNYEVRVANTSTNWIPSAVADTRNAGNATFDRFSVGVVNNAGGYWTGTWNLDIGDVYFNDTAGAVNNTFNGDTRVIYIKPTGAGTTTQLTPDSGSNWDRVDDAPAHDSDTSYVESAVTTLFDTYATGDIDITSGTVFNVTVLNTARKTDAGVLGGTTKLRTNGTNYTGTAYSLGDTYARFRQAYETNPNTEAAWSISEVNAVELGAGVQ